MVVILSKDSKIILKTLSNQEKSFMKKRVSTAKVSYDGIKSLFPNKSHMLIITTLQYLLEERYIYNHLAKSPNYLDHDNIEKSMIAIGEKGIAYLKNAKYRLLTQIIPLSFSAISLIVSILNLFIK